MKPGTIIVLNGTSSSGKTTLVKVLQAALPEPFLDAGLDRFIWMMPRRYLDRPLWDDVLGLAMQAGQIGHQLVSSMHQAITAISRSGSHVIADHVLVEPTWVQECADLFSDLPAYLVGVRCPLDVLIQREQERQDRTLGQAEAQFNLVHRHELYDIEVNTSVDSPEVCVRKVMSLLAEKRPFAFQQLKQREKKQLAQT
jgi:chloramphenicol 3-O phosphotransferase